jgi:hypothetical protein
MIYIRFLILGFALNSVHLNGHSLIRHLNINHRKFIYLENPYMSKQTWDMPTFNPSLMESYIDAKLF